MRKTKHVKSKPSGRKSYPAKRAVETRVSYLAKYHGIGVDEAWAKFVAPAVNAEFLRCSDVAACSRLA